MADTSEPASGSVTAMADTVLPAIAGPRYSRFSSSLPNSASEGVDISVWTLIASVAPALSERPSSSCITALYDQSSSEPPYSDS